MIRLAIASILSASAALAPAAAQQAGDAAKGKTIYQQQCQVCHHVGSNSIGPNLVGVYGDKAAAVPGYSFSPAMKKAGEKGLVWDEATLNKFLENPQSVVPGTKMAYLGLKDAQQRADVIAYLKTLKSS